MAYGGRSQIKMSDQVFDFVCTACAHDNKTVEAVKYCVQCGGYCCQSCTDTHKRFPTMAGHHLIEVSQGKMTGSQSASLPEFPTERCSKHKGKVMDMYCEGHDVVGCSTCFVKDHKSCNESHIHSIPDMIDTIFKLSDCKQTHSLLKDMVVSMETVYKSKDKQLETLYEARIATLNKVTTFQKALEAIIRKAAESSKQYIEAEYRELETEIIKEKQNAETICNDLLTIDEKLNQSEGNRAQRFVCSKGAQEKIKEAESEKTKQEVQHNADIQISFIPDQLVMEYFKALQGIGQIQRRNCELYQIKESKNIDIHLSDDSRTCSSYGCCLVHDNQLLVTDANNKKMKRIDIQKMMSVVDYCTLDSAPYGICSISKHEVAIACMGDNKVQVVSVQGKMSPTKQIKMSHECYGIAFNDGKLYITDWRATLYVYDMTGTLLKTTSLDDAGNRLFNASRHIALNESGNKMFVGGSKNIVVCLDDQGNYLSTIADTDLSHADGVCVDGKGNMFVVGYQSNSVVQCSETGKKVGVVVKNGDGLLKPVAVCFHQGLNRMFVTMRSNVVKMYELE